MDYRDQTVSIWIEILGLFGEILYFGMVTLPSYGTVHVLQTKASLHDRGCLKIKYLTLTSGNQFPDADGSGGCQPADGTVCQISDLFAWTSERGSRSGSPRSFFSKSRDL